MNETYSDADARALAWLHFEPGADPIADKIVASPSAVVVSREALERWRHWLHGNCLDIDCEAGPCRLGDEADVHCDLCSAYAEIAALLAGEPDGEGGAT